MAGSLRAGRAREGQRRNMSVVVLAVSARPACCQETDQAGGTSWDLYAQRTVQCSIFKVNRPSSHRSSVLPSHPSLSRRLSSQRERETDALRQRQSVQLGHMQCSKHHHTDCSHGPCLRVGRVCPAPQAKPSQSQAKPRPPHTSLSRLRRVPPSPRPPASRRAARLPAMARRPHTYAALITDAGGRATGNAGTQPTHHRLAVVSCRVVSPSLLVQQDVL